MHAIREGGGCCPISKLLSFFSLLKFCEKCRGRTIILRLIILLVFFLFGIFRINILVLHIAFALFTFRCSSERFCGSKNLTIGTTTHGRVIQKSTKAVRTAKPLLKFKWCLVIFLSKLISR